MQTLICITNRLNFQATLEADIRVVKICLKNWAFLSNSLPTDKINVPFSFTFCLPTTHRWNKTVSTTTLEVMQHEPTMLPYCSCNDKATANLVVFDVVATSLLGTWCGGMLALIVPLTWKCGGKLLGASLAFKTFQWCFWVLAISIVLIKCIRSIPSCAAVRWCLATVVLAGVGSIFRKHAELKCTQLTLKGLSRRASCGVCALVFLQALEESKALSTCTTLVPSHATAPSTYNLFFMQLPQTLSGFKNNFLQGTKSRIGGSAMLFV